MLLAACIRSLGRCQMRSEITPKIPFEGFGVLRVNRPETTTPKTPL